MAVMVMRNPVAPGEMGEVCVRRSCNGEMDPVFMLGYWNNPQATAEKFFGGGIADPQAWGRTGDLAKMDEDGALNALIPKLIAFILHQNEVTALLGTCSRHVGLALG